MNTYQVRAIRKEGLNPFTRQNVAEEVQAFSVRAKSRVEAFRLAVYRNTILLMGQMLEIEIDGTVERGNF